MSQKASIQIVTPNHRLNADLLENQTERYCRKMQVAQPDQVDSLGELWRAILLRIRGHTAPEVFASGEAVHGISMPQITGHFQGSFLDHID